MHTVDLLEHAIEAARHVGYKVRQEWFGTSGGACEIKGQKWLFLDLSLNPAEQLRLVCDALCSEPSLPRLTLHPELERLLHVRKIA
jgi:hypothetical protein